MCVCVSVCSLPPGAGVGPTIQMGEQTVITVDAKAAGKGKVTCSVSTPEGVELGVDGVENADGTFDIFYTAPQPGDYCICLRFGGEHIPNSPFQVTVGLTHPHAPSRTLTHPHTHILSHTQFQDSSGFR